MHVTNEIKLMLSDPTDRKPQTPDEFRKWNDSFHDVTLTPLDLAEAIASGCGYTAMHIKQRRKEEWVNCPYISIDLEKHPDAALDAIEKNAFFNAFGFLSYTTLSHTDTDPRSRALFILSKPIENAETWQWASKAVAQFFEAADPSCSDISRGFLGNPNTEMRIYGNFLPTDTALLLAHKERQREENAKAASYRHREEPSTPVNIPPLEVLQGWLHKMSHADQGGRNNLLNRIAFNAGKFLVKPGKADKGVVLAALFNAAADAGLDAEEIHSTLNRALEKGINS